MEEQNKASEQSKPQKKLSRTTLTFYIVGLFSVAIALILISYVAQARADKQLDTLNDKLTEQQTVAQGATQKMEELQRQYDTQQQLIDGAKQAFGKDALLAAADGQTLDIQAGRLAARSSALSLLTKLQQELLREDYTAAQELYDEMVKTYTEAALTREGSDETLWLLTEEEAKIFQAIQKQLNTNS